MNIEEFNNESMKRYKSVMTIQQYNEILCILTYWVNNAFLTSADEDYPKVNEIFRFWRMNEQSGYNYDAHFKLLNTKQSQSNRTPKTVLLQKKTNGIVLQMLELFAVIQYAHMQKGLIWRLRGPKQPWSCSKSATYDLVKLFVDDCPICHKKNSGIAKQRDAMKPIISAQAKPCLNPTTKPSRSPSPKCVSRIWIRTY